MHSFWRPQKTHLSQKNHSHRERQTAILVTSESKVGVSLPGQEFSQWHQHRHLTPPAVNCSVTSDLQPANPPETGSLFIWRLVNDWWYSGGIPKMWFCGIHKFRLAHWYSSRIPKMWSCGIHNFRLAHFMVCRYVNMPARSRKRPGSENWDFFYTVAVEKCDYSPFCSFKNLNILKRLGLKALLHWFFIVFLKY